MQIQQVFMTTIELKALSISSQQFYFLTFYRINLLFLPSFCVQSLLPFSTQNQEELGKVDIKFNLQYLQAHHHLYQQLHMILLTNYQQIAILPFICTKYPHIRVVATTLMCELGRIYAKSLLKKIKEVNVMEDQISYTEEIDLFNKYEHRFGIQLDKWSEIYSNKQLDDCIGKIIRVNYYQVLDSERGITLVAHPSGKTNGSCFWEINDLLWKEKLIWANELSFHKWRTCQSYNLNKIEQFEKLKSTQYVILTEKCLKHIHKENSEQKVANLLKNIAANIEERRTTNLILEDQTLLIDILTQICSQFQGKIQSVLLSSNSTHEIATYCNSFVEYLSDQYKNRIYRDPPEYPLANYANLREKGILRIGSLQEIAIKNRLPLKQLALRNNPFLNVLKDYQYILDGQNGLTWMKAFINTQDIQVESFSCFDINLCHQFLSKFSSAKIFTFTPLQRGNSVLLSLNESYKLNGEKRGDYCLKAINVSEQHIHRYKIVKGEIIGELEQKQYLHMPKDFLDTIFNQMIRRGINIIQKDSWCLKTERSQLTLSREFKLSVVSKSIEEVLLIEHTLGVMGKKLKLR